MAASISHFLTAAVKFSRYSSNEIGILCLLISGSSSFSVIHANVDFLKLSRKKESASLLLFFISKSPSGYAIYCRNARVRSWNAKFHPALYEGVDLRTDVLRMDDFLRTKIFWMHRFTKFSYPRCSAASASRARAPLWKGGAVLGLWYFPVVWDRNERWCRNIRGEIHPWHDSNSVSGMYVWSKSIYFQFWLC